MPASSPARLRGGAADGRPVARKNAAILPPLSTTLLPAEAGDVLELRRTLELRGLQAQPALGLDRPLPPTPPGRGVLRGRPLGPECPCVAWSASRLATGAGRPAATGGWLAKRRFRSAPTAPAARVPARPATSNVGTAPCVNAWAALFARRFPSPSASGCTKPPCACSCIIRVCF